MTSPHFSELFQVQSHSCYLSWVSAENGVPEDAVSFTESNGTINIGRVKRNDHTIPGALRDGVCRFYFNGSWQEERDRIEVLKDNFGAASSALTWTLPEEKDGETHLSLNSEVGGVFPGGVYVIARKKGSLDIMPIAVKEANRDFEKGRILYEGEPITGVEVLESSYHRMIAICPRPPTPELETAAS